MLTIKAVKNQISSGGNGARSHFKQHNSMEVHLDFKKNISKYPQPPPISPTKDNINISSNQRGKLLLLSLILYIIRK